MGMRANRVVPLQVGTLVLPHTPQDRLALRMFRLRQFSVHRFRGRQLSLGKELALDARALDNVRFSFITTFFLTHHFSGFGSSILIGG